LSFFVPAFSEEWGLEMAALGRTLSWFARIDMRLNPLDLKESRVLDVTHNSVWICNERVCLGTVAVRRRLSSKFLKRAAGFPSCCSLAILFWKRGYDGVSSLTCPAGGG
jgi:hypothetical protein